MKSSIIVDDRESRWYFTEQEYGDMAPKVKLAHDLLHSGKGPGKEFTGWIEWGKEFDREEYNRVKQVAGEIRTQADAFIVVGVGGSYMGAKSAIEMLCHTFINEDGPEIFFAGHQLSSLYYANLLKKLNRKKEIYINVVSKSGTTLEPAIAFRILRGYLEERYGAEGARKRIIATTDKKKGALKQMAAREGYRTFVVPDNIGGRYSVLTSVGLLPIAACGIDIDEMMEGVLDGKKVCDNSSLEINPAYQYAVLRNLFYLKGKSIEVLVNYEPYMHYFGEWWKQLFGESEGKNHKGLFPASAMFTTDLHSLGQYIQEGRRNLFLTTLWFDKSPEDIVIPLLNNHEDGLEYLVGRNLDEIKNKACQGTMKAHSDGGVPNIKISIPEMSPYYYGQLVYFFEKACSISGYLLGVNPFDQPGVEMYKKNVTRLLKKPESAGKQ